MGNPELKGGFVGGENHRTIHGGFSQQFPDFMAGKARKSYTWQVGKPHSDPSNGWSHLPWSLECHDPYLWANTKKGCVPKMMGTQMYSDLKEVS